MKMKFKSCYRCVKCFNILSYNETYFSNGCCAFCGHLSVTPVCDVIHGAIPVKTIGWWYHKLMCEFWYKKNGYCSMYYKHLNIMIAFYGINLHGEKHIESKEVIARFRNKYNSFLKRL